MARREVRHLSGTLLDERTVFSLRDVCNACGVHAEIVIEMVEEGLLEPGGADPVDWRFPGSAVTRAQKAIKLARELRVNWPGAALVLDLREEIERLRPRRRRTAGRSESVRDLDP